MSTKEKLIARFRRLPKDFTFDEFVRLFGVFGFMIDNKGKTSGSRVLFKKGTDKIDFHKPHPSKIVGNKVLKEALDYLIDNEFIKLNT